MNAAEILKSHEKFHITLGLERIKKILSLLGDPQDKYKIIHIAGTNGKGSTSKIINQILIENNIKTGLFVSPHIFSYVERIKVNNENISEYVFNKLTLDIDSLAKTNNIELSEFELITAVAFYYFFIKKVDYVVLETGLGGLLDATNVVKNSIAIITTIGLEHTERLGSTIEEIAAQKAGIIKQNSKVIVSPDNLGFEVIKKVVENKNAQLIKATKTDEESSLLGEHQKLNLALATAAAELLNLDYKEAIKKVKWPFRLQYFKDKNILIDAAHNPCGIKTLRDFLDKNFKNEKKVFIFGCLKNKDYKTMLNLLLKEEDELCFMEYDYPNSLKYDEFLKLKIEANKIDSIDEALKKEGLKVFCGSIYMLGLIFNKREDIIGSYEEF